jgi:hypothetical protein
MVAIPTIKVHRDGSWVRINQRDFDPATHIEWQDGDELIVAELKKEAAAALFPDVEDEPVSEAEPVAVPVEIVPTEPAASDDVQLVESEDSEDEDEA